jgi:hypothetical protein
VNPKKESKKSPQKESTKRIHKKNPKKEFKKRIPKKKCNLVFTIYHFLALFVMAGIVIKTQM